MRDKEHGLRCKPCTHLPCPPMCTVPQAMEPVSLPHKGEKQAIIWGLKAKVNPTGNGPEGPPGVPRQTRVPTVCFTLVSETTQTEERMLVCGGLNFRAKGKQQLRAPAPNPEGSRMSSAGAHLRGVYGTFPRRGRVPQWPERLGRGWGMSARQPPAWFCKSPLCPWGALGEGDGFSGVCVQAESWGPCEHHSQRRGLH